MSSLKIQLAGAQVTCSDLKSLFPQSPLVLCLMNLTDIIMDSRTDQMSSCFHVPSPPGNPCHCAWSSLRPGVDQQLLENYCVPNASVTCHPVNEILSYKEFPQPPGI